MVTSRFALSVVVSELLFLLNSFIRYLQSTDWQGLQCKPLSRWSPFRFWSHPVRRQQTDSKK
jgi:hypothetical protein